jgi:hypothetical protein
LRVEMAVCQFCDKNVEMVPTPENDGHYWATADGAVVDDTCPHGHVATE